MQVRFWVATLLVLTVGGLVCAQDGAETFDLAPHYELGDRQESEARLSLLLKIRLQLETHKIDRTSEQEQVIHRRYRDVLTKVEDGRVAEVERQFVSAWTGLREPGAPSLVRTLDPVHQRKIVIGKDADGKRKVWPRHGDLPRDAIEGEMPTERYEAALPSQPVVIGESWVVEGEPFRRALGQGLGPKPKGRILCKLLEVREEALDALTPAERYAVVSMQVEASGQQGTTEDAPMMETTLKGELRFSLSRHKIATVHLRGEAHLTQTRKEGEAVLQLDGRGPVELKKRMWFPAKPRRPKKKPR